MAKPKDLPAPLPPPPDLGAAYDALQAAHAKLQGEHAALKAEVQQGPKELEPLRRECEDLRKRCEQLKAQADGSRNAAARAQQELAAARASLPDAAHNASKASGIQARTFMYVKGNPKDPNAPRERVRAFTQALADQQAAALIADGYQFRGCV